jgi:hypothetical protein
VAFSTSTTRRLPSAPSAAIADNIIMSSPVIKFGGMPVMPVATLLRGISVMALVVGILTESGPRPE